jgi:hypothetical protein
MKRLLALGALTAAAIALPASPAIADAPPGQGLQEFRVQCDAPVGEITVVGTVGDSQSRWVDDQHMVLLSISFTVDGVEMTLTSGKKTGLAAGAVSCTVADGTTIVRAPVPPGG